MLHPERCPLQETLPSRIQKVQPVPILRGCPHLQELEREHIRGATSLFSHATQAEHRASCFFKLIEFVMRLFDCKITPYLN